MLSFINSSATNVFLRRTSRAAITRQTVAQSFSTSTNSSTSKTFVNRRVRLSPTTLLCTTFTGVALITAAVTTTTNPTFNFIRSNSSSNTKMSTKSANSLSELSGLKDIDGNEIDTSIFSGKVVFAMNVASACGYTKSGYDLMKRLTTKFSSKDFVAVAIPCNSFGWQENGSPEDIKMFALSRADKLVITERSVVNGDNPHPIVALAKSKFPGRIMWNFDGRFVFDRSGQPVAKFGNSAKPEDIEAAIEKLI